MSFLQDIFFTSSQMHIAGFALRGIIAFLFLLMLTRLMGPVELGQFTTIDFIVAITIGSIASAALVDSQVHFLSSLLNMTIWAVLCITLNIMGIRFPQIRRILVGGPLVLIKNGKIQEKNLFRAKLNFDDLMSALRLKGVALLEDVEFAVLEPRGEISVIKKTQKQSLTPEDLKMVVQYQGFPSIVILNGKILTRNLHNRGFSVNWLKEKLGEMGVDDPKSVSIAQLDSHGNLYVDLYNDEVARPHSLKGKKLIIKLKKIKAELESFAYETENEEVKSFYLKSAEKINKMLTTLKPMLLTAEEIKNQPE